MRHSLRRAVFTGRPTPAFGTSSSSGPQCGGIRSVLETMSPGSFVGVEGKGPLVKVIGAPRRPALFIVDPKTGLVRNSRIELSPAAYALLRWGSSTARKLVLTFDDGPDPRTTGKILDVLKAGRLRPCSSVVGENALNDPSLVTRMMTEGHEIGNHFFLHGNPVTHQFREGVS